MTTEQQTQLAQLEETIRQAQQQIEELKNLKPKKFVWNYPLDKTYIVNIADLSYNSNGRSTVLQDHGRYRLTKEAAEQSLSRNKRANRLEALAEQLGGYTGWVEGKYNYCIYLLNGQWENIGYKNIYEPEKVYMTQECANEICRMLNEGEFSLDGEL